MRDRDRLAPGEKPARGDREQRQTRDDDHEIDVRNPGQRMQITSVPRDESEVRAAGSQQRAEECEDWGQSFGPESMMVLPLLSPLVKASLRAAGRGGVERVREILDRARKDLEAM